MKTMLCALAALMFLAGAVTPSSAETFSVEQLDADGRGGHHN